MTERREMNQLQKEHGEWANKTFPSHYREGKPNPYAPLNHLTDDEKGEIWELTEALMRGDADDIRKELADCQLLLYSIACLCNVDLEAAAWDKYHINVNREWGEPDEKGVVGHIRGEA